MKINKDNYEAYFLDYFEGNLTSSEIDEMLVFIEQHPEVRNEFDGFESVSLLPDKTIRFEGKESLKKNGTPAVGLITIENYEKFLIAETEGLLSEVERIELEEFLATHPQFEKDKRIYAYTRLMPDMGVTFGSKELLKHTAVPFSCINESNYEEFLIQEVEGILSAEQVQELEQFLSINTHLQKERKLFGYTRLEPDSSIVFAQKKSLRRSVIPIRRITYYALSLAASVTLLFGLFFNRDGNDRPSGLALNPADKIVKTSPAIRSSENKSVQETAKYAGSDKLSSGLVNMTADEHKGVPTMPASDKTSKSSTIPVMRNSSDILVIDALACNEIKSHDYVEPEFMFIRTSQMHSNTFLELYYNIKLAEQIQYAQLNATDPAPEKTLLKSIYSKATGLFASNRKSQPEPDHAVTIWTFAELGVKTYNNITQDDVQLGLEKDENGKVVSYNLTGDKLDLQRELKK